MAAGAGGALLIIVCSVVCCYYCKKKKTTPATATAVRQGFSAPNTTVINLQQQQLHGGYQMPVTHAPPQQFFHQSPPHPILPQAYLMEPTPLGDRYADEAPPSYELAVAGYGLPGSTLGYPQASHPHQGNSNM